MTPNDLTPRPEETFWAWLRRTDSATAELAHQNEPLADQHAAYRVGSAVGAWATLFECFKLLEDTTDAPRILSLAVAGQVGLRNRRDDVRTLQQILGLVARRVRGRTGPHREEQHPGRDVT